MKLISSQRKEQKRLKRLFEKHRDLNSEWIRCYFPNSKGFDGYIVKTTEKNITLVGTKTIKAANHHKQVLYKVYTFDR